jgi:hypothetical protein
MLPQLESVGVRPLRPEKGPRLLTSLLRCANTDLTAPDETGTMMRGTAAASGWTSGSPRVPPRTSLSRPDGGPPTIEGQAALAASTPHRTLDMDRRGPAHQSRRRGSPTRSATVTPGCPARRIRWQPEEIQTMGLLAKPLGITWLLQFEQSRTRWASVKRG